MNSLILPSLELSLFFPSTSFSSNFLFLPLSIFQSYEYYLSILITLSKPSLTKDNNVPLTNLGPITLKPNSYYHNSNKTYPTQNTTLSQNSHNS
ncbi:hypothetical protein QL285_081579 [Trifolium repens]|nr:hypothetical protein QL285_081579 [Trifolium repens]